MSASLFSWEILQGLFSLVVYVAITLNYGNFKEFTIINVFL